MYKMFIALLACLSISVHASQCNDWLASDQQDVVNRAYQLGVDNDMGWSLAAIAFKESSAGRVLVNDITKDYGVFGININTATRRTQKLLGGVSLTDEQIYGLSRHLTSDFNDGAMFAIFELTFWIKVHGEDWKKIWAGYNGGYSRSNASLAYSDDIIKIMKKLKKLKCIKNV